MRHRNGFIFLVLMKSIVCSECIALMLGTASMLLRASFIFPDNRIAHEGYKAFADALKVNNALKTLDLYGTHCLLCTVAFMPFFVLPSISKIF